MISKQTTLDLNGPILSFIQQPQSVSIGDAVTYTGTTTPLIGVTYNGYPVRGYLYYPTSPNTGQSLDVVVLYHGTITSPGVSPADAATTFINIALNRINLKDKLIFSVAYPQDAIPLYEANPSLAATQFPGLNYSTFYFGDNIVYAEAALLWVKNNLNVYMSSNGISKIIDKIFTFGHSQGAYLVHRLNTIHPVDGVISNAPGPIDLLDRCSIPGEQTVNITCNKIGVGIGTTSANPEAYNTRSLKSYLSGTLSPQLFTQAFDDEPYQVNLMQTVVQPGLATCTNCSTITFNYYTTGGHDSFVTNTTQQQDIRDFVGAVGAGIATFVGIATVTFTTVDGTPTNPATNTGSIAYQWYEEGVGALSNSTYVTGTATTTLTLSNLITPTDNQRKFYVEADYAATAYQSSSPITAGTARSTGNAINEPLNSNTASVTVFPLITITSQPEVATVTEGFPANFSVDAILSDSTFGSLSYQWQLNQQDLSDNALVQGSSGETLTITPSTAGISTVRVTVSNPNAPSVISNNANLNALSISTRKLVNFEYILLSSTTSQLLQTNLFDGEYIISQQSNQGLVSFYSPEIDINVEMDLYGGKGSNSGTYLGGEGGFSRIRFTMIKNTEYVIVGLNSAINTPFIYRKGTLIATVGAGGNAGTSSKGGSGGGIRVSGTKGNGTGGGLGGLLVAPGQLPSNGIVGSATSLTPISPNTQATAPNGGRVLPCTRGVYWRQEGVSPCSDVGTTQFRLSAGAIVTNTASITRGFKAGYGINETSGQGSTGGGNGGSGATGGQGGTNGSGGGGGSGYTDRSVTVVSTQLGGSTEDAKVILRLAV
jgi:hypothetical protein